MKKAASPKASGVKDALLSAPGGNCEVANLVSPSVTHLQLAFSSLTRFADAFEMSTNELQSTSPRRAPSPSFGQQHNQS